MTRTTATLIQLKYAVFRTAWGYFGLAGTDTGLLRSCLPQPDREKVTDLLLAKLSDARQDPVLFKPLQEQIIAYFNASSVDFNTDIAVLLDGFGPFARSVLTACRKIRYGGTLSYGELAQKAGKPAAARAVGAVLARNPLPLIIPCHRVVRSDGKIGGFTAPAGVSLKRRMLELEGALFKR